MSPKRQGKAFKPNATHSHAFTTPISEARPNPNRHMDTPLDLTSPVLLCRPRRQTLGYVLLVRPVGGLGRHRNAAFGGRYAYGGLVGFLMPGSYVSVTLLQLSGHEVQAFYRKVCRKYVFCKRFCTAIQVASYICNKYRGAEREFGTSAFGTDRVVIAPSSDASVKPKPR